MPAVKLTTLLRIFYETRLPYVPIVEELSVPDSSSALSLIGFLSREQLQRQMADLGRVQSEYDRIPASLLVQGEIPDALIQTFKGLPSYPVYDLFARLIARWDIPDLMSALARYREALPLLESANQDKGNEKMHFIKESALRSDKLETEKHPLMLDERDPSEWLARGILSTFQTPLYAVDLNGKTLFFNEGFEKDILPLDFCGNSLRIAERYFQELSRELIAKSVMENGEPTKSMFAWLEDNRWMVELVAVEYDEKLIGYLFRFEKPQKESALLLYPLAVRVGLEKVLDDIESRLIHRTLQDMGENISHAAKRLKLRRSTLQNKIKRLDVGGRLKRIPAGPIRRGSSNEESSPVTIVPLQKKSPPATHVDASKDQAPIATKKITPVSKQSSVKVKASKPKEQKQSQKKSSAGSHRNSSVKKSRKQISSSANNNKSVVKKKIDKRTPPKGKKSFPSKKLR